MAWHALRPQKWDGREVEAGELLVPEGEAPPVNMAPLQRLLLVIEVPPGHELWQPSPQELLRIRPVASVPTTPEAPTPTAQTPAPAPSAPSPWGKPKVKITKRGKE